MPPINSTKLSAFQNYQITGTGVGVLDAESKVKTVDNDVSIIGFFEGQGAKASLSVKASPTTDTQKLAKTIDATPQQLDTAKNDPAAFAALIKSNLESKKDYFYPTFGQLQGAPSRFKFNTIVGMRIDQFGDEATKIANELYPAGPKRDQALFAVNTAWRDLLNRKVEFDTFETNGYASFGHDAAFIHVYEKKLEQLEAMDLQLLTPEQRSSVERQKKQIQGELDDIFRHKYVYNSSSMYEVNAEISMGLVAIDKKSRQRVSELETTLDSIVPKFEILNVTVDGQKRPVFYDHSEKKYFFDGSSEAVPQNLVSQIERKTLSDTEAKAITFRRAKSGEQLRKNFRFDWDQDGYVSKSVIDWVSWGGHCNDKAALEQVGLVVPKDHKGVYEYDSAAGTTVHYDRDLLNEKLFSFSEMGSEMGNKSGGDAVKDIGKTEYASARDDDRPDKLMLSNGRTIPFRDRPNKFEITEIKTGDKTYTGAQAFSEYVVGANGMSAEKNPLYKSTTEGDYVNLKLGEAVLKAKAEIQVFDEASGYPKLETKNITIDFANPPAEPVLIDTMMKDAGAREMYEISLDLKKKEWVYELVRMEKQPDGKYKKVKVASESGREKFDEKKLEAKRETSLDDPAGYVPFVEGAMKTGRNATAETADGSGVWNGRILTLNRALVKREGSWEKVSLDVDARYGGNHGEYLAHLDAKGKPDFFVPIKMPADFWWRQQIAFAPEKDGLVNVTARDRGAISIEGGQVKADAIENMMEVLHCAFNNRNYTIVHNGKRYFFETEAQWKAEIAKLDQMRAGVYVGGTDPGPGPAPVVAELAKESGSLAKNALKQITITAEADGPITVRLNSKTGDADLYVKKGGPATDKDHTLASWKSNTEIDEVVIDAKKGETYGIAVHGYKPSDYDLVVTGPKVGGTPAPAPQRVDFHLAATVLKNEEKHFQVEIKEDGEVEAILAGNGDADLYLRIGQKPTKTDYDVRPYLDGTNERGKIKVKKGDVLYGMVRGYGANSDFDLNMKSI
jgi:hypothetical protein